MKIGILTFQWSNNYGAALQSFALKSYLSKNEENVVSIINYKKQYKKPKSSLTSKVKDFILFFLLIPDRKKIKRRNSRFDEFREEFFGLTSRYNSVNELNGIDFDFLFFGSDQIWNPKLTGGVLDPAYFGCFNTNAKKIAFSASIGEKSVRPCDAETIKAYLNCLDSISVRESQMLNEISKYTTKKLTHTLDPTLLLDESDYRDVASGEKLNDKYLLIYQNTRNNDIYKIAKQVAKEKGLKIYEVGYRLQFPSTGVPIIEEAGPKEFLALFRDAEYVVTNTFHGTVFSIIFRKQFISIPLAGREHRVVSLAQKLDLKSRLIDSYDYSIVNELINKSIEYDAVLRKLQTERKNSERYIIESLNGEI